MVHTRMGKARLLQLNGPRFKTPVGAVCQTVGRSKEDMVQFLFLMSFAFFLLLLRPLCWRSPRMQVHSFVNHDHRVFGANGLNFLVGERGLVKAPLATMAEN